MQTKLDGLEIKTDALSNKKCTAFEIVKVSNLATASELRKLSQNLTQHMNGLSMKVDSFNTTPLEFGKVSNLATSSELRNLSQILNGLSMKVDSYRDEVQNCSAKTLNLLDSHLNSTQPGDSVHIPPNSVIYIG